MIDIDHIVDKRIKDDISMSNNDEGEEEEYKGEPKSPSSITKKSSLVIELIEPTR